LHKVKSLNLHAAAGHEAGADGFIDGPQPVGGQLHAAGQGLARQVQAVAREKKRIFVTLDKGLSYFIRPGLPGWILRSLLRSFCFSYINAPELAPGLFTSLVYTEHGLALGTAFPPDGEWLRKMQANSMRISPGPKKGNPATCAGLGFAAH
jgi:hypothetical protein